jgi:hypothetical protein
MYMPCLKCIHACVYMRQLIFEKKDEIYENMQEAH